MKSWLLILVNLIKRYEELPFWPYAHSKCFINNAMQLHLYCLGVLVLIDELVYNDNLVKKYKKTGLLHLDKDPCQPMDT